MSIVIETRIGAGARDERLPLGEFELEQAVGRLDGGLTTVVTVSVAHRLLFVGGGPGNYTVTSFDESGTSIALVGDPELSGETLLMMGGQVIPQPRRYLVGLEDALRVAKHFVRTGELDADELWEQA